MGSFKPEQINKIKEYLNQQGLTFQPLRNEMVDHLSCDIENRMIGGVVFEEALNEVLGGIPISHFKTLQQETMETISKRFGLVRRLSYLSLALIFSATTFKLMHWPGAGQLILASFGTMAESLLAGSISGAYLNKERPGRIWVFSVVIGMVILLTAYSFKTVHWPGANVLILVSSGLLIVSMCVVSITIYRNASGEETLLTHLHKKHTPGIERFLLILLSANVVFKVAALATASDNFIGQILILIVIYGAIFHFIASIWKSLEERQSKKIRPSSLGFLP